MPGFVDKISKMWNPPDDDYEENYDYEDEDYEEEEEEEEDNYSSSNSARSSAPSFFHRSSSSSAASSASSSYSGSSSNNVVNFSSRPSSLYQVVVLKPTTYTNDAKTIADAILSNCVVVMNLERASADDYLKILLFINGITYAKNAEIKMVATKTYIITPHNVDLSGDVVLDSLEQSGISF